MTDTTDTDEDDGYFPLLESEDGDDIIITPIVQKKEQIQ